MLSIWCGTLRITHGKVFANLLLVPNQRFVLTLYKVQLSLCQDLWLSIDMKYTIYHKYLSICYILSWQISLYLIFSWFHFIFRHKYDLERIFSINLRLLHQLGTEILVNLQFLDFSGV